MGASLSPMVNRLSAQYHSLVGRYGAALSSASSQRMVLIAALIVAGIIAALIVAAMVFMPAKRKVVRKRRVRRTRREVVQKPVLVGGAAETSAGASSPKTARSRRRTRIVVTVAIWVVAVPVVLVGTYIVTGSNRYCGQSCHAKDKHVIAAVNIHHADCIACHEPDPVTGLASRVRMAYVQGANDTAAAATTESQVDSTPVDPNRCLRCHADVVRTIVRTKRGLIVSHKEILAGGRTCSDCHTDIGHLKGASLAGGMSECTACHDGVTAKRTCETCHAGGSPITVAGAATKATSAFDYGPAIRVASKDCSRCHGAETECKACHNGLVLPHPVDFVQGGHARMAAFGGKQMCYKCHSLAWCGSGKCHNSFSAHDAATWPLRHQAGTSANCGSCHMSWDGTKGDFCKVCH